MKEDRHTAHRTRRMYASSGDKVRQLKPVNKRLRRVAESADYVSQGHTSSLITQQGLHMT